MHLADRKDSTIRVDISAFFEEIFGCFDGIQHDDYSPKDAERYDIA
jgi:hypothetical protein